MKFGLQLFGKHPRDVSPQENFQSVIDQVVAAREAGFDMIGAGHHFLVEDYQKFQVMPTMGRLAAEAGEMHVGMALLLPLHHPVVIAEQLSTLDAITGGRTVVYPVAGYRDEEFDALGIDKRERLGRLVEGVKVMKNLWTEDEVDYDGKIYGLEGATINPKPVSDPHPAIWIGANRDSAVKRASELGDAWLINPHEDEATIERQLGLTAERSGEGMNAVQPARRDIFVAETDREALETFRPKILENYGWYKKEGQHEAMENPDALDQDAEHLQEHQFIAGSPDTVVERLLRLHNIGIDLVLMKTHRAGIPPEKTLESIRLMGEEVIPRVRKRIDS